MTKYDLKMGPVDGKLNKYATDREWHLLREWHWHSTQEDKGGPITEEKIDAALKRVAKENKCFPSDITKVHRRVLKKAARQGYAPEYDLIHEVPEGLTLSGTSILYDADGKPTKQWNKTKPQGMDPDEAVKLADPKKITKLSTLTGSDGRVIQQWTSEKPEDHARERAWTEFAKALAEDIPRLPPIPAPAVDYQNMMVGIPVGDHHMGMLSWNKETGADYDLKIGEELLCRAIDRLMRSTEGTALALIAFLGDFMHYDGFESVTPTSRNQLDSDTRYPKMVRASVRVMRYVIDRALEKHGAVHVKVEIGNHDLSSSIFLMECLSIAYENEPRVFVDTSPSHYHYLRFGQVLLGTHHGHGTKMANLPLVMAADRKEDWGVTKHRYIWTGHIHTSKTSAATNSQDYSGVNVESFRILPPSDAWAAQKGYRPIRDMKAIVYHKDYGEMERHTVNPDMLGM